MAQLNSGSAPAARLAAGARNTASGMNRGSGAILMDRDIVCDMRFQLLLYFSFWYDLLFTVLHIIALWYKWRWILGPLTQVFAFLNIVFAVVVEPTRLYIGYAGNLGEKVPHLLLFIFLCCIPMLWFIVQLIFLNVLPDFEPRRCSTIPGKSCVLPIEKACWLVQIGMLLIHLFLGIRALRSVVREKSARFFRAIAVAEPSGPVGERVPLLSGGPVNAGSASSSSAYRNSGTAVSDPASPNRPSASVIGRGTYSPLQGTAAQQHSHAD